MRVVISLMLLCAVVISGCSQPATNAPKQPEKEDVEKAVELTHPPETTDQGGGDASYTASEQANTDAAKAAAADAEVTHDAEASAIAKEQSKETPATKREASCRIEHYADERGMSEKEAKAFAVLIGLEASKYHATYHDVLDLRGVPRYEDQCKADKAQ